MTFKQNKEQVMSVLDYFLKVLNLSMIIMYYQRLYHLVKLTPARLEKNLKTSQRTDLKLLFHVCDWGLSFCVEMLNSVQ